MSAWLIVDEIVLGAVRSGSEWWFWYRHMAEKSQRPPVVLTSVLSGEVVALERDTLEDCYWLRDYMVSQGVPKRALKVATKNPLAGVA